MPRVIYEAIYGGRQTAIDAIAPGPLLCTQTGASTLFYRRRRTNIYAI